MPSVMKLGLLSFSMPHCLCALFETGNVFLKLHSVSVIRPFDVHYRYVFVAETCLRVFLAMSQQRVVVISGKLYRFLRAILYARKTEFAIALGLRTLHVSE